MLSKQHQKGKTMIRIGFRAPRFKSLSIVAVLAIAMGGMSTFAIHTVNAAEAYTISGKISFGSESTPLTNGQVSLYTPSGTNPYTATVNSDGSYIVSNISAGEYRLGIRTESTDSARDPVVFEGQMTQPVTITDADQTLNFNFNVRRTTVSIIDSMGDAIPNAKLKIAGEPRGTFSTSDGIVQFTHGNFYGGYSSTSFSSDETGKLVVTTIEGLRYSYCAAMPYVVRPQCGDNYRYLDTETATVRIDTTNITPLAPERDTAATTSPAQYPTIAWKASKYATSYNVYREGAKIGSTTELRYLDNAAPEGLREYAVTAVNDGRESPQSKYWILIDRTPLVLSSVVWSASSTKPGTNITFKVTTTNQSYGNSVDAGEYYIGDDPGYGNATSVSITRDSSQAVLSGEVGADLSAGIHTLHVRARDQAGNWSSTSKTLTVTPYPISGLKADTPTNTPLLRWDTHPAADSYTVYRQPKCQCAFSFIGTTNEPNFTDNQVAEGDWVYSVNPVVDGAEGGSDEAVHVKVDKSAPIIDGVEWDANPIRLGTTASLSGRAHDTVTAVAAAEYFIGEDPGSGKATAVTAVDGQFNGISFGNGLGVGVYLIGIRFKDTVGNWSETQETMLTIYDANSPLLVTGKNKKGLVPSLQRGDILPGLVTEDQSDTAEYGFTVEYKQGVLDPKNDLAVHYETGTNCGKKTAQNCHSFSLNATSFEWLVVDGQNNAHGQFKGVATVVADGITTMNPFIVKVTDGDRLAPVEGDEISILVYEPGSMTDNASPLYQISGDLSGGNNVKIQ